MSERYGTPGELQELLEDFEVWLREELLNTRNELIERELVNAHHPRYNAGRLDALRDVLAWWRIDD